MGYMILEQTLQPGYPVTDYPILGDRNPFKAGKKIKTKVEQPVYFETACPCTEHPGHYLSGSIPIFSKQLIDVLKKAGINNFQKYPAILVNTLENYKWDEYYAFNEVGVVDAVASGPGKNKSFREVVIDSSKVKDLLMFRDERYPTEIIFNSRLESELRKNRPPEGWSIRLRKLEYI